MANEETLACSLSGPKLVEQIDEWAQVASQATSRDVEKGRIVSTFPPDEDLLRQLRKLIAAEADCCPFMQFNIEEGPEEVVVELCVPDSRERRTAWLRASLLAIVPIGR